MGRLLRPAGRCARRLDGSPRRPCRGTHRSAGGRAREPVRPRRETQEQRTDRQENREENRPRRAGPEPSGPTSAKRLDNRVRAESRCQRGSTRPEQRDAGPAEHSTIRLGCILRLFERQLAACVQLPGTAKPQQQRLARRGFTRRRDAGDETGSERGPHEHDRSGVVGRHDGISKWCTCAVIAALLLTSGVRAASESCSPRPKTPSRRSSSAAKAGQVADLMTLLGADGKELIESSDPAIARQNRQRLHVATGEQWHLEDAAPIAKRSSSAMRTGRSRFPS